MPYRSPFLTLDEERKKKQEELRNRYDQYGKQFGEAVLSVPQLQKEYEDRTRKLSQEMEDRSMAKTRFEREETEAAQKALENQAKQYGLAWAYDRPGAEPEVPVEEELPPPGRSAEPPPEVDLGLASYKKPVTTPMLPESPPGMGPIEELAKPKAEPMLPPPPPATVLTAKAAAGPTAPGGVPLMTAREPTPAAQDKGLANFLAQAKQHPQLANAPDYVLQAAYAQAMRQKQLDEVGMGYKTGSIDIQRQNAQTRAFLASFKPDELDLKRGSQAIQKAGQAIRRAALKFQEKKGVTIPVSSQEKYTNLTSSIDIIDGIKDLSSETTNGLHGLVGNLRTYVGLQDESSRTARDQLLTSLTAKLAFSQGGKALTKTELEYILPRIPKGYNDEQAFKFMMDNLRAELVSERDVLLSTPLTTSGLTMADGLSASEEGEEETEETETAAAPVETSKVRAKSAQPKGSGKIRVRSKATGKTGMLSEKFFDPNKYEKL